MYFTDNRIDALIKEDVPYIDLTTTLLDIGNQDGLLKFRVREAGVVACTEEVVRIFEKLGLKVTEYLPSGTFVEKGTTIFLVYTNEIAYNQVIDTFIKIILLYKGLLCIRNSGS